jgi:hypothetical protein
LFVFEVDQLYKLAIQQHYNSFHFVDEPLIPIATKALLYDKMSTCFPMHCAVLESICTTEWNLHANNAPAVQKKKKLCSVTRVERSAHEVWASEDQILQQFLFPSSTFVLIKKPSKVT